MSMHVGATPISDDRALIFLDPKAWADMDAWHAVARDLRENDPVLRVEAEGFTPFWALTRHADVFDVSRRSDLFLNTQNSILAPDIQMQMLLMMGVDPKTLIHLDGQEHTDYRKVTNEWFKPAAVKALQGDIDRIADQYIAKLGELGGECDFAQDIAVPYTMRVIMSIFGVPPEDEPLMLSLTQGIFGAADPEYLGDIGDPFQYVTDTIATFDNYFAELTADRRAHPTNDLASVIANGQIDGCPLGNSQTLWYYIIVATAGHDTTSYALSGGVEQLLRHPDQVQALRDDPELALNAAHEAIRWSSPVRHFLRYAQEDTTIRGVAIPKGDRVLMSYPSANRDDDVFDNPDSFDIRRPDVDQLISFGVGVHHCLGAQVARRELRTFLPKLLDAVDTIELSGEPQFTEAHFVGGVKHLPVTYTMK